MSQQNLGRVLKRLELDQSTGSLVCVGEDNAFSRIYVVDGKPRAARCRSLQGTEALAALCANPLASVKFHAGVNLIKCDAEDAGIAAFSAGDETAAAEAVESSGDASASAVDILVGDDEDALGEKKLNAAIREALAEELIEYVGPIAQMVVGGLDDDISLVEALKLLALEIDDKQMAAQFVERVRQKI